MDDQTTTQPAVSQGADQGVEQAVRFLQAVFAPGDIVLFRPIETWTENGQKKSTVDYKGIAYHLVGGKNHAGQWECQPRKRSPAPLGISPASRHLGV